MIRFGRKLLRILKRSGIKVEFIYIYVDDIRIALNAFSEGTVYCSSCSKFKVCREKRDSDMESGESPETRTSRVLLEVLNSLEPKL